MSFSSSTMPVLHSFRHMVNERITLTRIFLRICQQNLHNFFSACKFFYLRLNLESIAGTNRHFIDRIISSSKYGLYLIHFDYYRVSPIQPFNNHSFLSLIFVIVCFFSAHVSPTFASRLSDLIGHFFFFLLCIASFLLRRENYSQKTCDLCHKVLHTKNDRTFNPRLPTYFSPG